MNVGKWSRAVEYSTKRDIFIEVVHEFLWESALEDEFLEFIVFYLFEVVVEIAWADYGLDDRCGYVGHVSEL